MKVLLGEHQQKDQHAAHHVSFDASKAAAALLSLELKHAGQSRSALCTQVLPLLEAFFALANARMAAQGPGQGPCQDQGSALQTPGPSASATPQLSRGTSAVSQQLQQATPQLSRGVSQELSLSRGSSVALDAELAERQAPFLRQGPCWCDRVCMLHWQRCMPYEVHIGFSDMVGLRCRAPACSVVQKVAMLSLHSWCRACGAR